MQAGAEGAADAGDAPQTWATSISLAPNVLEAIDEAVKSCLAQFVGTSEVDLALFHVTSSHLNACGAEEISAALRERLPGLKAYLGSTCGGTVASLGADQAPVEVEAQPAFSLTLASLPGVDIRPFWLDERSLPSGTSAVAGEAWQDVFGVKVAPGDEAQPVFLTYPLPGFSNYLGDLLTGLDAAYPLGIKAGGIASAVSTLHKPRAWVGYGKRGAAAGAAVLDSPTAAGTGAGPDSAAYEEAKRALMADMDGSDAAREDAESLQAFLDSSPIPPEQVFGDSSFIGGPEVGFGDSPTASAEDAFAAVGGLGALSEAYDDEPLDVQSMLDVSEDDGSDNSPIDIAGGIVPAPSPSAPPRVTLSGTEVPCEGDDAFWDGCCGVILTGDIRAESMVAAGARPVSPVYYCAKSEGNTLKLIRQAAGKDGIGGLDPLAPAVPPLKESSRLQNDGTSLSADDVKLMQRGLLVGLEAMPRAGPTAADAERILKQRKAQAIDRRQKTDKEQRKASGKLPRRTQEPEYPEDAPEDAAGPLYSVQKVLRTSMKDGSFLLPEAASEGQRMRFFVRDRFAAEKNLESVLSSYKRRALEASMMPKGTPGEVPFNPALALMISGMDRGRTMFGEVGFESRKLATYVKAPISGFFSNGPIAAAGSAAGAGATAVHGSSTTFLLLGPRSNRPVGSYFPKEAEATSEGEDGAAAASGEQNWEDWEGPQARRRVTDTGRSMNVGSVEWSVAEKTAQPRNRLEALVWAKEAEVDRLRDRYPLPMLLAKVKMAMADPAMAPRKFLDSVREVVADESRPPIIAELKKSNPFKGVLRADYSAPVLAASFEQAGAAALSICIDGRFFGGSVEDITAARVATKVPLLASDFVLYPYQIYQARIAGADALRLTVAALPSTDLIYFHKIIAAQGMDPIVVASSLTEAEQVIGDLHENGQTVKALVLSGRDYADFSAEPERVAGMLRSPRGEKLKAALKEDGALLLSEGGIQTKGEVDMLLEAGVEAVIVGETLVKAADPELVFSELVG